MLFGKTMRLLYAKNGSKASKLFCYFLLTLDQCQMKVHHDLGGKAEVFAFRQILPNTVSLSNTKRTHFGVRDVFSLIHKPLGNEFFWILKMLWVEHDSGD